MVRFVPRQGHRHITVGLPPPIDGASFEARIADKAFDSNAIVTDLDARSAKVVIAQHAGRARARVINVEMCK